MKKDQNTFTQQNTKRLSTMHSPIHLQSNQQNSEKYLTKNLKEAFQRAVSPTRQSTATHTNNDESNYSNLGFNRYDDDYRLWKNIRQSTQDVTQSENELDNDTTGLQHVSGILQRSDSESADGDNGDERIPESPYWMLIVGLFILCMLLGCG